MQRDVLQGPGAKVRLHAGHPNQGHVHQEGGACPLVRHRRRKAGDCTAETDQRHRDITRTEFEGIINNLERRFRETNSEWTKDEIRGCDDRCRVPGLPRRPPETDQPGCYGGRHQHQQLYPDVASREELDFHRQDLQLTRAGAYDRRPHPARRSASGWAFCRTWAWTI